VKVLKEVGNAKDLTRREIFPKNFWKELQEAGEIMALFLTSWRIRDKIINEKRY
jgi:hypothetical protein